MKMSFYWSPSRWSLRLAVEVLACGETTVRRVYRLHLGPLVLVRVVNAVDVTVESTSLGTST